MLKITAEEIHFIIYQYLLESGKCSFLYSEAPIRPYWTPQDLQILRPINTIRLARPHDMLLPLY